ncbi:hypothetical protein Dda_1631 [Drechslerella dactyloides]|uniref:Uncharacterized protein n=1 Tax=Drechslerella dactyloides TaxID=74499 RepID=A0AAD6J3E9_DREDA|nr:hypothetical protein Dda_1631 [Drechslerella dactyloides]
MSCSLILPWLDGTPAGSQFFYPQDGGCLGVPGYVNGSDCASWPEAGQTATADATFIFSPTAGVAVTSACGAPLYTTEFAANPVETTMGCSISNNIFESTGGVGFYIYPTNAAGDLTTQSWTIGEYPGEATATETDGTLIATNIMAAGFTTVPTIISTVIDSTSTYITTFVTTYSTLVLTATVTSGATTVTSPPLMMVERQACALEGPAGFYASDDDAATVLAVTTIWAATSTLESTFTPTAYSTGSSTYTSLIIETSTFINSVVGASVETEYVQSTVTVPGEQTTTTPIPTGTVGPFVINVAAIVTITTALERDVQPTAGAALKERQDFEGWVGLADADGTIGAVDSIDDALQFYVIDGELVTSVNGEDWYTYTELSVVTDPGYETWVLQNTAPGAGDISTEFSGVDLQVLDWSNADFPSITATLCLGEAAASNPDVPLLNWWYDVSQAPPEGNCIALSVSVTEVAPGPGSTTVTSLTTVTSISTITGDPITTYVCDNVCPNACTTEMAMDLITTTVCSTAPNGLSTCQACISSTPAPVIETALEIVTSTIPCPNPPCAPTVLPPPPPYNPPCNGDTVTVYGGDGGYAAVPPAVGPPAPAGDAGAAPPADAGAGAGAAAPPAADAGSTSSSTTKTSTTRTTTPTASPSMGDAGKLDLESASFLALLLIGAYAFLA